MPALLRRLAVLVALLLLAGCSGGGSPPDAAGSGPAGPTSPPSASSLPGPSTTVPRAASPTTLRQPPPQLGIISVGERKAAPDLSVTAFDGRTVTLAGFRGKPAVVNFFESW
jgi:hypothetical protein